MLEHFPLNKISPKIIRRIERYKKKSPKINRIL